MNQHDDDLMRQLSVADAAAPPPPGQVITPERLHRRQQQHRVRALLASAAMALFGLSLWTWWPQTQRAGDSDGQAGSVSLQTEVQSLMERTRQLLDALDTPPIPLPDRVDWHAGVRHAGAWPRRDARRQLRFELAAARAGALASLEPIRPENR